LFLKAPVATLLALVKSVSIKEPSQIPSGAELLLYLDNS
jgi:hypothetical protein